MSTANDAALARKLQQDEMARGTAAPPPAYQQPAGAVQAQVVYATPNPMAGAAPQQVQYATDAGLLTPAEATLLEVYSLGRGIRCLSIIDLVFLILQIMSMQSSMCYLLWGPLLGFYGATRYSLPCSWAYGAYYIMAIAGDILSISYVGPIGLLFLMVHIWILQYICKFVSMLKRLSPEELFSLRNPQAAMATNAQPYFRVF